MVADKNRHCAASINPIATPVPWAVGLMSQVELHSSCEDPSTKTLERREATDLRFLGEITTLCRGSSPGSIVRLKTKASPVGDRPIA